MHVSVIGAGKMGLPIAAQLASRGATVEAVDVNKPLVDAINAGRCPFDEPGVGDLVRAGVEAKRLSATTDTAAAASRSDVVIVIVPAVLTPERDIEPGALLSVSETLAFSLKKGALVCYETTMPVGGTRAKLLPVLESKGKRVDVDFDLAFSPERVKSQFVLRNLTVNPKVVGGHTKRAGERAAAFYRDYIGAPVVDTGSMEAAEMVKIAGMVYRDVNIALANEMARYAEAVGVDLPALIAAINTDGEAQMLIPGIGVGGHCTPVYPYFYIRDAERRSIPSTIAANARRVNDEQPGHALDRLAAAWMPLAGKRVAILGLAFRPEVKEHIFSPAFQLREELQKRGAEVFLHDPLYTTEEIAKHGFRATRIDGTARLDALVLCTAHSAYRELSFRTLAASGVGAILDGRNALDEKAARAAGLTYVGIGRPFSRSLCRSPHAS